MPADLVLFNQTCLLVHWKSYLTDAPPSDMPTNSVKLYQPRLLHCTTYMPYRDLLCRCSCNIYACWPSATVTNTVAVQTCQLVDCCCKMGACWTVANQSACLLTFCYSILDVYWRCASLSAIPADMVPRYQPCLLVWYLIISRACWHGASL